MDIPENIAILKMISHYDWQRRLNVIKNLPVHRQIQNVLADRLLIAEVGRGEH